MAETWPGQREQVVPLERWYFAGRSFFKSSVSLLVTPRGIIRPFPGSVPGGSNINLISLDIPFKS